MIQDGGDRVAVECDRLARMCGQHDHIGLKLLQASEREKERPGSLSRAFRIGVEVWPAHASCKHRVAGEHRRLVQHVGGALGGVSGRVDGGDTRVPEANPVTVGKRHKRESDAPLRR